MLAEETWAEKADYLIARFGAGAVGVLLGRIAEAVRLSDDVTVGRLDRLLQNVERRLHEPWRILPAPTDRLGGPAEPMRQLMTA